MCLHVPASLHLKTLWKQRRQEKGSFRFLFCLARVFENNFENVLTDESNKILLEIFPLEGSSLKFTLCDWLGPPIKIQNSEVNFG